ncbi:MAG: Fic family protein [Candidatus Woesearchaeota archaeon]
MPTMYDVFAAVIEHAPCAAKDLPFTGRVYAQLDSLVKEGLLEKRGTQFIPRRTERSEHIFTIIRYSLKNGLDYNLFLAKNTSTIVRELFRNAPYMRPAKLQGNQDMTKKLTFFEEHQFILLTQLRPRRGVVLEHTLFNEILALNNDETPLQQIPFIPLEGELLRLPEEHINPFDEKVFDFLSGSAQLEGSTVTPGETKDIILNDIYPDKPKNDIQMVKNLNEAMHYVLENLTEEITPEHIRDLNKMVLFSLHRGAGKYKKAQNTIQGNPHFTTAPPEDVPRKMSDYCAFLASIMTKERCVQELGRIHNGLQSIHPFNDGNSRTTRMIVNWMLLKHKLPLLVLKNGCFEAYMSRTKLAKKRDDEDLKKLLHHVLYHENIRRR